MRLAIFDVDGTLISGKSTEKRFISWLMRHGLIGPRQVLAAVWHVIVRFPLYGRHVFRKNKAYLSGMSASVIAGEASRFIAALPDSAWIRETAAELREHRERGDVVILMSGTLQPIIDALAAEVGASGAIGTTCDVSGGHFTARPPREHPFHDTKAILLDEICAKHGVDPGDVVAYADSHFDIPLLERAGTAVAVGPDRGLEAWAVARGCRIVKYEK